jgi:hypothetical protein
VVSGTKTRHEVKGIGNIRFQLEASGFLKIEHIVFFPELRVNLLLVSTFKDGGYGITF